jgi:hypothetical protein
MRAKYPKPISAETEKLLRRAAINTDSTIRLPKPRTHCARTPVEFDHKITPSQVMLMDAILAVAVENEEND